MRTFFASLNNKDHLHEIVGGPVARAMFGLPFVVFGAMHFKMGAQMAGMVPAWIPGDVFWVYFTGAALIAGGLAMISNKLSRLAGYLMALQLLGFVVLIHFPSLSDPEKAQFATLSLLKDFALAGASLLFVNKK